ncbi:hypothetical protein Taro_020909 [Colocasia esculenta]|uniref:Uncharacterized protein n=1 Tax=Colocasia esculenta TaxID=4460 RepID=A0A843V3G9_COLES|nr:hypothetical protein [Colocasia esculenta]
MEPLFESSSACAPRVAHGAGQDDVMNGKVTASCVAIRSRWGTGSRSQPSCIFKQLLGRRWACSHREDTVCSGRNAVWDSYLAFFAEELYSMAMESGAWAPVALEERVVCAWCSRE